MRHIAIIGNGISGITAARHIRKLGNHQITVISSETEYFFSRTALMYIYMGHMKYEHTKPYEDGFWKKNRIDLKFGRVVKIDFSSKQLVFYNGHRLKYDDLIIATGSRPNKFGWQGQDIYGVQGLYSYHDLQDMEKCTTEINHAVVVGGGLIGIEMVEMLLSRKIPVTFLVREESFWDVVLPKEESALINRHIRAHNVDLRLNTELKEIISNDKGRVKAVITNNDEAISCQFVGLAVGVHPNIEFLRGTDLETNRGVLVDEYLATNIPHVYAIGDCAEHRTPPAGRKAIEQVWYTGRIMGETVAKTICGNPTRYHPGHWFNSAKFFDIEYQTYGQVNTTLENNETDFYWEHKDGKKCIHVVFDKDTLRFKGINTFGIRMRHEVFDKWLTENRTITYVMEYLKQANFDPEFFKRHEKEIINAFNSKFPEHAAKSITKTLSTIFSI